MQILASESPHLPEIATVTAVRAGPMEPEDEDDHSHHSQAGTEIRMADYGTDAAAGVTAGDHDEDDHVDTNYDDANLKALARPQLEQGSTGTVEIHELEEVLGDLVETPGPEPAIDSERLLVRVIDVPLSP